MFEQASRKKIRFSSIRGEINAEQLWDLPLTSKAGFDLDSVAKETNRELKSVTDESFVVVKENPARADLTLKMEIVKHVIAVKQHEAATAQQSVARRDQREKLLGVLQQKQDADLQGLSKEEIMKKLEELS